MIYSKHYTKVTNTVRHKALHCFAPALIISTELDTREQRIRELKTTIAAAEDTKTKILEGHLR